MFAPAALRDLDPPALRVCRLTLVILNLGEVEKQARDDQISPQKTATFLNINCNFNNNLQRTQSRCCCRGRNSQRTRFQVSSGSQRRTASPCTHLCLRRCNRPSVSRWSWRKTPAAEQFVDQRWQKYTQSLLK